MTDVDQVAPAAAAVPAAPAAPAETNRERVSRRQVDKFAERRAQLADAALQTLAELGYARTSLREIAQNTEFSHGVLHYYFSDKEDLITHCVRQYEAACVTRYDEIVATATSAGELKREFSTAMAQTLRTDAPMHRLWYDLRNQSLFEESFRADVLEIDQRREDMIWRVISRYASFAGVSVALAPGAAYADPGRPVPAGHAALPGREPGRGRRSAGERGARARHPGGPRAAGLSQDWILMARYAIPRPARARRATRTGAPGLRIAEWGLSGGTADHLCHVSHLSLIPCGGRRGG